MQQTHPLLILLLEFSLEALVLNVLEVVHLEVRRARSHWRQRSLLPIIDRLRSFEGSLSLLRECEVVLVENDLLNIVVRL